MTVYIIIKKTDISMFNIMYIIAYFCALNHSNTVTSHSMSNEAKQFFFQVRLIYMFYLILNLSHIRMQHILSANNLTLNKINSVAAHD